jgi:hypothetical protein
MRFPDKYGQKLSWKETTEKPRRSNQARYALFSWGFTASAVMLWQLMFCWSNDGIHLIDVYGLRCRVKVCQTPPFAWITHNNSNTMLMSEVREIWLNAWAYRSSVCPFTDLYETRDGSGWNVWLWKRWKTKRKNDHGESNKTQHSQVWDSDPPLKPSPASEFL